MRPHLFSFYLLKKNQLSTEPIEEYDANNLWILNLTGYWRMIYTLRGETAEIIALILDVIDHDVYNKLFGFREK